MAGSARDIFMAVRVVDRATGPLRRIAGDLRRMEGATASVGRQRQVIAGQRGQIAEQRRAAMAEMQSLRTGKLRQESMGRLAAAQSVVTKHESELERIGTRVSANTANRLNLMNQIKASARGLARAEAAESGMFGGKRPGEWQTQIQKLMVQQKAAIQLQQRLQRDAETATSARSAASLSSTRAITAEEERRAQSLRELRSTIMSTGMADNALVAEDRRLAAIQDKLIAQQRLMARRQAAQTLEHLGHAMTIFGLGATVAFGLAAKAASDFATQSTQAATQSVVAGQGTVAQVQKNSKVIQQSIQDILRGGAVAGPSEQASAAYEIFSGVTLKGTQMQQLKQGAQLLREFNKAAVANYGLVSLEEITRAGIILMNRFNLSVTQIPDALNTMQAAVRFGKMTMAEFITTLNQAAPAAQGAGYNLTQMSASIAFISRQFPSLRLGATGYARLLETFARKDIQQGLRRHGVEITKVENGVRKLVPIEDIAARVIHKFGGNVKEGSIFLQNFFKEMGNTASTIQARRVLVAYVQHLGQAQTILRQVSGDQGELNRSFLAMSLTPGVKLTEVMNRLRADVIQLGNAAIPVFVSLGIQLEKFLHWFENLSPHTKRMIGTWGAWIAVGTLVAGMLTTVVAGLATLGFSLALVGGKAELLRLGLMRLGALGVITIAILLVVNKEFRDKAKKDFGEFSKGTLFDWQRRVDNALLTARNAVGKYTGAHAFGQLFNLGKDSALGSDYSKMIPKPVPFRGGAEDIARTAPLHVQAVDKITNATVKATKAAIDYGVVATPSFQKLYIALRNARGAAEEADRQLAKNRSEENQRKDIAAWKRVGDAKTALQENVTKQQYDAATHAINELNKKNKDGLTKQEQDFKATADSVHNMYQQLLQENQQLMGTLFQGPMQGILEFRKQWGARPTGGLLLKDLQGQVRQFTHFEGALTTLRKRGAPEELIQQLRSQGIQALPDILALTRMSGGMWSNYVKTFAKSQKLIKDQTIKDLNSQLSLYKKFGTDVGKAIQEGIAGESPGLKREIRNLILKMFPELKPTPGVANAPTSSTTVKKGGDTHNHFPTTVHTSSSGKDVHTALAKQRSRIRSRTIGGRTRGD